MKILQYQIYTTTWIVILIRVAWGTTLSASAARFTGSELSRKLKSSSAALLRLLHQYTKADGIQLTPCKRVPVLFEVAVFGKELDQPEIRRLVLTPSPLTCDSPGHLRVEKTSNGMLWLNERPHNSSAVLQVGPMTANRQELSHLLI